MQLLGLKNIGVQEVATDELLSVGSVYRKYIRTNCCDVNTFSINGSSVSLNTRGMYKITITAIVAGQTAGDVTLQLLENGTPITGALATASVTTPTTELHTISIDYIVLVDSTYLLGQYTNLSKNITIENVGVPAVISNLVINIEKIL